MIEIYGNLWDYFDHDHIICITTNGTLKKGGYGVMGRGCAREAVSRIHGIEKALGRHLSLFGNHVGFLTDKPIPAVLAFPVKHAWWQKADTQLIERSVVELDALLKNGWAHKTCILPRPGCGNGHLSWATVKPLLEPLPDYVRVITHIVEGK